jgi:hypothetical protein
MGIINSTLIVELQGGIEALRRSMRRTTVSEIGQAERRGVRIREGDVRDLSLFFELMSGSCRRQGTRPNPSSEKVLREIWGRFSVSGSIRLNIAECEGEPVAGALCIAFGDRVTFWKKGWGSRHADRKPNSLVCYEALQWSCFNGYRYFDFASLDRSIACSILRGSPLSEAQRRGRDFFHLGFGGRPVLLPEARILIANRPLRAAYGWVVNNPAIDRAVKRRFANRE